MNSLAHSGEPGKVIPFKRPDLLEADEGEIRRFVETIFAHCADIEGYISLRAFEHESGGAAVVNRWVPCGSRLLDDAVEVATAVANRSYHQRAVFSPPVCVFGDVGVADGKRVATEANVVCAPAIAVELDERPNDSLAKLIAVLGDPTIVIASGGQWCDPADVLELAPEQKLHAYWRLRLPAVSEADRLVLRKVRAFAARLVASDATAVPLAHPMRWPGSWHTKTRQARLSRITGGDPKRDVELSWAAVVLSEALSVAGLDPGGLANGARGERLGFKTQPAWPAEVLEEAAKLMPNEGLAWDAWNRIGMALYDASHGDVEGLDAFHAWSEKDDRYDPDVTDARWSHWRSSPPSNLSGGTLLHEIRKVKPGFKLPRRPRTDLFDEETAEAGNENEPVDIFGDADPASLGDVPAGSLPAVIERWARSEARRKGTQTSFPAVAAVTAAASAIGTSLRIAVRQHDDWNEPASLWSVLIAPPGSTKSPVIAAAVKPLRQLDGEWLETDLPQHAAWAKASRNRKKDAPPVGPEPRVRRAVVDDVTAERLIGILADNPNGLLRDADELTGILGGLGAYKANADGDRSQLLRLFDGGSISRDRQTAGSSYAKSALLSIIAGSQPLKIQSLVDNLGTDGLLQRFVFVVHDGTERRGIDEPPDLAAAEDYGRTIRGLKTAAYPFTGPLRLSPAAGRALSEAEERLNLLRHVPGAGPAFQDHVSKWGKILPRLVLTFHAVEEFALFGVVDTSKPIEAPIVEMAARFARFLIAHSLRFYETFFGTTGAVSEARWIAGHLLTKPGMKEVSRRDVYDARTKLRGPENVRALLSAMRELETAGWCEVAKQEADGPTRWSINPRIHSRFAARAARERQERTERHSRILAAGHERRRLFGFDEETTAGSARVSSVFD